MNRTISAIASIVLSAIALAVAGYFNSKGVIPIGDMRVPSTPVGSIGVAIAGVLGAVFGNSIQWGTLFDGFGKQVREAAASVPVADTRVVVSVKDKQPELHDVAPYGVPEAVDHINHCIYFLRCLLKEDAESQTMLDKLATSANRKLADVTEVKAPVKVPAEAGE